jgi:hypothetical protein
MTSSDNGKPPWLEPSYHLEAASGFLKEGMKGSWAEMGKVLASLFGK